MLKKTLLSASDFIVAGGESLLDDPPLGERPAVQQMILLSQLPDFDLWLFNGGRLFMQIHRYMETSLTVKLLWLSI